MLTPVLASSLPTFLALVPSLVGKRPKGGPLPTACAFFLPLLRDPSHVIAAAAMVHWRGTDAISLHKPQFAGGPMRLGRATVMQRARRSRRRGTPLRRRQFEGPTSGLGRPPLPPMPGAPGRKPASRPATATSAFPSRTMPSGWQPSASAKPAHPRRQHALRRPSAWMPCDAESPRVRMRLHVTELFGLAVLKKALMLLHLEIFCRLALSPSLTTRA
jgi:hypothetical protein